MMTDVLGLLDEARAEAQALRETDDGLAARRVRLGNRLFVIRKDGLFKAQGYERFEDWVKACMPIQIKAVNRYIALRKLREEDVAGRDISFAKLEIIARAEKVLYTVLCQHTDEHVGEQRVKDALRSGARWLKDAPQDIAGAQDHVRRVLSEGERPLGKRAPARQGIGEKGKAALRLLKGAEDKLRDLGLLIGAQGSGTLSGKWVDALPLRAQGVVDAIGEVLEALAGRAAPAGATATKKKDSKGLRKDRRNSSRGVGEAAAREPEEAAEDEDEDADTDTAPAGQVVVTLEQMAAAFQERLSAAEVSDLGTAMFHLMGDFGRERVTAARGKVAELCAKLDGMASLPPGAVGTWREVVCQDAVEPRFGILLGTFVKLQPPEFGSRVHDLPYVGHLPQACRAMAAEMAKVIPAYPDLPQTPDEVLAYVEARWGGTQEGATG